jgi:hypothetical protein
VNGAGPGLDSGPHLHDAAQVWGTGEQRWWRERLLAVTVLGAGLGLPAGLAGAAATASRGTPVPGAETPLRARPLASDVRRPVGDGRSIAAWLTADGRIVTRDADGATRAVAVPDSCQPARFVGAGGGVVMVQCPDRAIQFPPPRPRYLVIRPPTGRVAQLVVPNPREGDPSGAVPILNGVGVRWARGVINVGPAVESVFVDWRTGRVLEGATAPFGPAQWLDLDATALARPLCAPYARQPWQDPGPAPFDRFEDGPQVDAGWVLVDGGYRYGRTPRLGRCGGPARPLGPDAASAEIGSGYVVWRARVDPAIHLIRLRDGRRFTLPGVRSFTAFTARELLVWTRGPDPLIGTLAVVALPR